MYDLDYIEAAKKRGDWEAVNKASLSRVLHHSTGEFGILTAYHKDRLPAENAKLHEKLKHHLRSMGYGHIPMTGHYTHTDGTHATEPALFVPKISKRHIVKLGQKFGQESVLHGDHGKISLHYTDGSGRQSESQGQFHPRTRPAAAAKTISEAYSRSRRGREFTYAHKSFAFEIGPLSFLEALAQRNKLAHVIVVSPVERRRS